MAGREQGDTLDTGRVSSHLRNDEPAALVGMSGCCLCRRGVLRLRFRMLAVPEMKHE